MRERVVLAVGSAVVPLSVGDCATSSVGSEEGNAVGMLLGTAVGKLVGAVGREEGSAVSITVGCPEGSDGNDAIWTECKFATTKYSRIMVI